MCVRVILAGVYTNIYVHIYPTLIESHVCVAAACILNTKLQTGCAGCEHARERVHAHAAHRRMRVADDVVANAIAVGEYAAANKDTRCTRSLP